MVKKGVTSLGFGASKALSMSTDGSEQLSRRVSQCALRAIRTVVIRCDCVGVRLTGTLQDCRNRERRELEEPIL